LLVTSTTLHQSPGFISLSLYFYPRMAQHRRAGNRFVKGGHSATGRLQT
jgi:hypothetical protein